MGEEKGFEEKFHLECVIALNNEDLVPVIYSLNRPMQISSYQLE
jgi:hypothetical protein